MATVNPLAGVITDETFNSLMHKLRLHGESRGPALSPTELNAIARYRQEKERARESAAREALTPEQLKAIELFEAKKSILETMASERQTRALPGPHGRYYWKGGRSFGAPAIFGTLGKPRRRPQPKPADQPSVAERLASDVQAQALQEISDIAQERENQIINGMQHTRDMLFQQREQIGQQASQISSLQQELHNAITDVEDHNHHAVILQANLEAAQGRASQAESRLQQAQRQADATIEDVTRQLADMTRAQAHDVHFLNQLSNMVDTAVTNQVPEGQSPYHVLTMKIKGLIEGRAQAQKEIDRLNARLDASLSAQTAAKQQISSINAAHDSITRDLRAAQAAYSESVSYQHKLQAEVNSKERHVSELQYQAQAAQNSLRTKEQQIESLKYELQAVSRAAAQTSGIQQRELQDEIHMNAESLRQAQSQIGELQAQVIRLNAELAKYVMDLASAEQARDALEGELQRYQSQYEALVAANNELQRDLANANERLQSTVSDSQDAQAAITSLQKQVADVTARADEAISVLQQQLSGHREVIDQLAAQKEAAHAEIARLSQNVQEAVEDAANARENLGINDAYTATLDRRVAELQSLVQQQSATINGLNDRIAALAQHAAPDHVLALKQEFESQIQALQALYQQKQQQLEQQIHHNELIKAEYASNIAALRASRPSTDTGVLTSELEDSQSKLRSALAEVERYKAMYNESLRQLKNQSHSTANAAVATTRAQSTQTQAVAEVLPESVQTYSKETPMSDIHFFPPRRYANWAAEMRKWFMQGNQLPRREPLRQHHRQMRRQRGFY